jgi:D-proline reductase (dithiol) PrdB
MVRLADLHPAEQKAQLDRVPSLKKRYTGRPWVTPPAPARARIAIVTTAGLHRKGDRPFGPRATDYRVIPGDTPAAALMMSHQSVNFDRSGFQEDHNIAFPIDRLRELAAEGAIGSLADYHYSFMGATDVDALEHKATELCGLLKKDKVDAVLLSPV